MSKRTEVVNWTAPLVLFALLGLAGCAKHEPAAEAPAPKVEGNEVILADGAPQKTSLSVETAEPRRVAITHLTGRLTWNDDITVRVYSPVAGRVNAILCGLGQSVSVDAPLARIDSPDFGQALADTRKAVADLLLAERTLTRERELFEHGAAAQKDVEAAEDAQAGAVSERDRALARLELYGGNAKASDELYVLRTPLAGVVVEKNINPGQEVRADQMLANMPQLVAPLFVVSDPATLWVQVDVSESDLSFLKPGQALRIYSRAYPDKVFDGVLENIGNSLDPATRTVKVRGVVDNSTNLLKAEMYVMVDVVQDGAQVAKAGVEVSAKAIFMKNNDSYLFIESSPGHYQRQKVVPGVEKDGKVPIIEGVTAGQKVVTEGGLLLQALVDPAS